MYAVASGTDHTWLAAIVADDVAGEGEAMDVGGEGGADFEFEVFVAFFKSDLRQAFQIIGIYLLLLHCTLRALHRTVLSLHFPSLSLFKIPFCLRHSRASRRRWCR